SVSRSVLHFTSSVALSSCFSSYFVMLIPTSSTLFPYTTLFRSPSNERWSELANSCKKFFSVLFIVLFSPKSVAGQLLRQTLRQIARCFLQKRDQVMYQCFEVGNIALQMLLPQLVYNDRKLL